MALISNNKNMYTTNIVDTEALKRYQSSVLKVLMNSLISSFGPNGSNTCIFKPDSYNIYTKDGHTILSNIKFSGIIEEATREDIESITRNIVQTVGDGTTSAVILSYYVFKSLNNIIEDTNFEPVNIIKTLNKVVDDICEEIKKTSKPTTLEDIRDIATVSSNNNNEIVTNITEVYKQYGMNVFVDVVPSTTKETIIKEYNGMVLNTGYCDPVFINNNKNQSEIDNANIYFFEDPIDSKEMGILLDSIISNNILDPLNRNKIDEIVPTVIIAQKISRDMSSIMDNLITNMGSLDNSVKVPINIISDIHQVTEMDDICKMCNAKPIHKYIDRENYDNDVKKGLAPTPENVSELMAGKAERVISDSYKTKFVNPVNMLFDEKGNRPKYDNLINFVKTALDIAVNENANTSKIGILRRRYQSLQSNLIELYVGGMTVEEREAKRHLMEDAVKNCRSAAKYGVGFGANMSAFNAIKKLMNENEDDDKHSIYNLILNALYNSYDMLMDCLYGNISSKLTEKALNEGIPIDITTGEISDKIKSSIESDQIILKSVSNIIGIMVTSNQFLTPNPQFNVYNEPIDVFD